MDRGNGTSPDGLAANEGMVRVLSADSADHTAAAPSTKRRSSTPAFVLGGLALTVAAALYGYTLGDGRTESAVVPTTIAPTVTPPPATVVEPSVLGFPTSTTVFARVAGGHAVPSGATEWLDANLVSSLAPAADGSVWAGGPGGVTVWSGTGDEHTRLTTATGEGPVGVHDVAVAPTGDAWALTDQGLAHWDGAQWVAGARVPMGVSGRLGLSELEAGADGAAWFSSVDWGGDSRNPDFSIYRTGGSAQEMIQFQVPGYVQAMAVAPDGALWVSIESRDGDGGVWRYSGEGWVRVIEQIGFVHDMAVAGDGTAWFIVDSSVRRWDGDVGSGAPASTRVVVSGGFDHFYEELAMGADGSTWVLGTSVNVRDDIHEYSGHELLRLDDLSSHEIPNAAWPRSLAVAADGSAWVGTDAGVLRFDGANWTEPRVPGLPQLTWPTSMAIDDDGVWVGQDAGLVWTDGDTWKALSASDLGWPPSAGDPQPGTETAWVASQPGAALFAGVGCRVSAKREGEWQPLAQIDEMVDSAWCWAQAHAVEPDGTLWLSLDTGGGLPGNLWRFDGGGWSSLPRPPGRSAHPTRLAFDDDGVLWGAGGDVARFDDGEWVTVLGGVPVGPIAVAGEVVWAGEECHNCGPELGGVWQYESGTWTRDMTIGHVADMAFLPDGTGWVVGTSRSGVDGLWRYETEEYFRLVIADARFMKVAVAVDGAAWVAAPGRLLHVPP